MDGAEPPFKRRRTDETTAEDWLDMAHDSEYILQSFGLDAKDEGHRVSIERAYSDARFQSTMAHIFEKYGRDFDGIGDEIDLMTGEIVVDNGHIHNMRNEIDVGDDFLQQQQQQQQLHDDIPWKEFTYTDDDEDEPTPQDKDDSGSTHDDEDDDDSRERASHSKKRYDDDDDDDDTAHGGQTSCHSMSLVPSAGVGRPEGFWPPPQQQQQQTYPLAIMPGPFWPAPFGFNPMAQYGFGPSPTPSAMPFAPSPYAMVPRPFPAAAWNMPFPVPDQQWPFPPVQRPQPMLPGPRYNFKAQKGTSSIWAVRSRYKESEDEPLRSVFNVALGKHLPQSRPPAMKSLPAPPPRRRSIQDGESMGDKETTAPGTAKRKRGRPRKRIVEPTPESTREEEEKDEEKGEGEGEDDCTGRDARLARRSGSGRPRNSGAASAVSGLGVSTGTQPARKRGRPRKYKPPEDDLAQDRVEKEEEREEEEVEHRYQEVEHIEAASTSQEDTEMLLHPEQVDFTDSHFTIRPSKSSKRGRPPRGRERVESPSGSSRKENSRQSVFQTIRIEIPALGQEIRDEYQDVEMVDEEILEDDQEVAMVDAAVSRRESPERDCEPDVPEQASNQAPEEVFGDARLEDSQSDQGDQKAVESLAQEQAFLYDARGFVLDDVPPMNSPKPSQSSVPNDANSAFVFSDDEAPVILSKVQVAKRAKRGKRSEESNRQQLIDLARIAAASLEAFAGEKTTIQEQHSPPSFFDTQDSGGPQPVAHSSPDDDHDSDRDTRDSRERLRDSSSDTAGAETAITQPSGYSSDAPPASSSPTRSLTRFTASVSLNDHTPRLAREALLLQKNAASFQIPNDDIIASLHDDNEGPLPRRRRRSVSRKSFGTPDPEPAEPVEPSNPAHNLPANHTASDSASKAPASASASASAHQRPESGSVPPPASHTVPPPSTAPSSRSHKPPKTPFHPRSASRLKTPSSSSFRSILSLAPAGAGANDTLDVDELGPSLANLPGTHALTAGPTPRSTTARKLWKSSALTTEVCRTPVRSSAAREPVSPGSVVTSPGGTMRVCGVDGYRCGRDFCFSCL